MANGHAFRSVAARVPGLRRVARPFRRLLAFSALVYEESERRDVALRGEMQAVRTHCDRAVADQLDTVGLLLAELWQRMEAAIGVQGELLQKVSEEQERIRRENSAILRLLADRSTPARAEVAAVPSWATRDGSPNGGGRPPGRYALFEEVERGSRDEVGAKLAKYVDYFRTPGRVVDLGCGRGEFLESATWKGIAAYGVDTDPDAFELCRSLGLDARCEDLFEHLDGLPAASLAGVFSAQVVEHLPPTSIDPLLRSIHRVLVPGGVVVIETPNPATFATHVQSFWRDPTHTRPVPAVALSFAARSAGLVVDSVLYSCPTPDEDRLVDVSVDAVAEDVRPLAEAFNRAMRQLNLLLYGPQDYALVASRPR
jgi:SAM-dependent methyltransferase